MKIRHLLAALLALWAAAPSFAAPPPRAVLLDFSSEALIDGASARATVADAIPARVWKLYPVSKYGFVSQVIGGLTGAGVCVVSARVMLVPITATTRTPLFRPEKAATTYEAATGSTAEQCRVIAKTKLAEAAQGVVSSLVKT
jgi:hypothetical protein